MRRPSAHRSPDTPLDSDLILTTCLSFLGAIQRIGPLQHRVNSAMRRHSKIPA